MKTYCCRYLFKSLNILLLQSECIFLLLYFIVMNMDQYKVNLDIHGNNSRLSSNFYQTASILSLYLRGTYCMGMKIFSSLPFHIKICLMILNSLNWFKEIFFIQILFIHWMNILITIVSKILFGYIIYFFL